ncbi:cyclophilin-like fold protein [uncultured Subdoligranulum sp.]|uniref:cyclophilin-like fold protein n=1 Tax=uncultured Subdoligranulum sp. TaxID=512298 RepID=UPI0025F0B1A2|nr:cyclophilin-like fold protein [uncultured Subdoligranulum sp.]
MPTLEILVGDTTFTAQLADTEAARQLAECLPLELDMQELNGNEKYSYLSQALSTNASCPDSIHTGDLMLFGSDCLVLFYKDFSTSYSYTPIGKLDNPQGLSAALGRGDVTVTFRMF